MVLGLSFDSIHDTWTGGISAVVGGTFSSKEFSDVLCSMVMFNVREGISRDRAMALVSETPDGDIQRHYIFVFYPMGNHVGPNKFWGEKSQGAWNHGDHVC